MTNEKTISGAAIQVAAQEALKSLPEIALQEVVNRTWVELAAKGYGTPTLLKSDAAIETACKMILEGLIGE